MIVPFFKAHGAGNDFLFTFAAELTEPLPEQLHSTLARAICHRNHGVGADGWYLIERPAAGADSHAIHLYNSDGSTAELSGNGTRCAAAILVDRGFAGPETVSIQTGAGPRTLRLKTRRALHFEFDMDMGTPTWQPDDLRFALPLAAATREVAIVDVGNPQCAVIVKDFDFDWRSLGAQIEGHPHFPKRTNVSFVRPVAPDAIEARFFERGAGPTLSSGTGSTGAAAAAILLGLAASPVRVLTEAGQMLVTWESAPNGTVLLGGPAEITARGDFFWQDQHSSAEIW